MTTQHIPRTVARGGIRFGGPVPYTRDECLPPATETTARHTFGPMHVHKVKTPKDFYFQVVTETGSVAAVVYPDMTRGDRREDSDTPEARLFASAPALLAACERVRTLLDSLPIAADSPQALILGRHNAYVDLGYAIAQATGQAVQA